MERGPVCSGHTPALSSRGHGQVIAQGWSCSLCLCEYMCDVFGAIMISLCFVFVLFYYICFSAKPSGYKICLSLSSSQCVLGVEKMTTHKRLWLYLIELFSDKLRVAIAPAPCNITIQSGKLLQDQQYQCEIKII